MDASTPAPLIDSGKSSEDSAVVVDQGLFDAGTWECHREFQNSGFDTRESWEVGPPAIIVESGADNVDPGEAHIYGKGNVSQRLCLQQRSRLSLRYAPGVNSPGADQLLVNSEGIRQQLVPTSISSTSPFVETSGCLGESATKEATEVTIEMLRGGYENGYFRLDYARIEEDPRCPAPGELIGGDFESDRDLWNFEGRVSIESRAEGHVLQMMVEQSSCESATASTILSVPSEGAYRLSFQASASASTGLSVHFRRVPGVFLFEDLSLSDRTSSYSLCVPPEAAGVVAGVHFELQAEASFSGECETQLQKDIWIDNIVVTEDASCAR